MKILGALKILVRNKYLVTLSAFVVWMLFFDRNDLFTQLQWRTQLNEMRQSKDWFASRIEEDRKFSRDLRYNAAAIEKYAREKYKMKRDNEDLFLIEPLKEEK